MLKSLEILLKNSFNRKVLFIFTVIVLDAVTTVWLMAQGLGEVNPAMMWVVNHWSVSGMAITKILWSLVLLAFVLELPEFKKYTNHLIIGYFLLYIGGWLIQLIMEIIR